MFVLIIGYVFILGEPREYFKPLEMFIFGGLWFVMAVMIDCHFDSHATVYFHHFIEETWKLQFCLKVFCAEEPWC